MCVDFFLHFLIQKISTIFIQPAGCCMNKDCRYFLELKSEEKSKMIVSHSGDKIQMIL